MDDVLLQSGHFLQRDFNAHVAAGDHDAVGCAQNLFEVLNAFHVLNLGDDPDGMTVFFREDAADRQDIIGRTRKGGGDKIKVVLNAEEVSALSFSEINGMDRWAPGTLMPL